jgi:hypothetical protein
MLAKDFLNQAFLIDQRIRAKSEQIRSLNEIATSCSATLTGMPRNPNRGGSRMADAVGKIIDLENEIAYDMHRLIEVKKEIVAVINAVDDVVYRTLLEKRYLCGATWEEITIILNCNRRWTFRLHDRALDTVQKILDKK